MAEANCDRASVIMAALPAGAELEHAHEAMVAACTGATDEPLTRALIGLMLDGIPSAKTLPSAGYSDALTFSLTNGAVDDMDEYGCRIGLERFSPAIIAAAVRLVWRQHTFAPSIHEFLTLANKAKGVFRQAADQAQTLVRQREEAEGLLIRNGRLAPSDDDIPFD
jgi:hypothetical protein